MEKEVCYKCGVSLFLLVCYRLHMLFLKSIKTKMEVDFIKLYNCDIIDKNYVENQNKEVM